jgi:hypothetical protein
MRPDKLESVLRLLFNTYALKNDALGWDRTKRKSARKPGGNCRGATSL